MNSFVYQTFSTITGGQADWIASDPSMLGEQLLVFGRQVIIPDTKDHLDLLAAIVGSLNW